MLQSLVEEKRNEETTVGIAVPAYNDEKILERSISTLVALLHGRRLYCQGCTRGEDNPSLCTTNHRQHYKERPPDVTFSVLRSGRVFALRLILNAHFVS
ncbi:MAG: hypothetical protein ACE5II_01705 [Anaerolineae bacterium]